MRISKPKAKLNNCNVKTNKYLTCNLKLRIASLALSLIAGGVTFIYLNRFSPHQCRIFRAPSRHQAWNLARGISYNTTEAAGHKIFQTSGVCLNAPRQSRDDDEPLHFTVRFSSTPRAKVFACLLMWYVHDRTTAVPRIIAHV